MSRMLHATVCVFIYMSSLLHGASQEVDPYADTQLLPVFDFGYYNNAVSIEKLFSENEIRVVIEVGSWMGGGSTRHFAKLLQKRHGFLYAVDTWLGSIDQQPGQRYYQPQLHQAYDHFRSNMIHWGFRNIVIPCRMTSLEAAEYLQEIRPDLIYIDAEHATEAVAADLKAWYPFVQNRGILCGDDWVWPSVRVAVEQFASSEGLQIEAKGNFWRLRK